MPRGGHCKEEAIKKKTGPIRGLAPAKVIIFLSANKPWNRLEARQNLAQFEAMDP